MAPSMPVINDVTTDPYNPPQFKKIAELPENKGRDFSFPKAFITYHEQNYPDIAPRKLKYSPEQAFQKCKEVGLSLPRWELVSEDPKTYTLEFVVTSFLMRFKDDVIVQVTPEKTGSAVHMRSRSRTGKSDLGVNAQRIRDYFEKLKG